MCAYTAATPAVLKLHREYYHFKRNPGLIRKDRVFNKTNTSDAPSNPKMPNQLSHEEPQNLPEHNYSTPEKEPKMDKPKEDNIKDQTFTCNQCDLAFTCKGNLKRHMVARHEGVKHHCDECGFAGSRACHVKRHKEAVRQGLRQWYILCKII